MKHYVLPSGFPVQRLPFYLAMEEWAARRIVETGDTDDAFFTWRVAPTVIFGRNQQIDVEVNLAYCRQHGVQYYRRKSGGGCVVADPGNIMFSYVTRRPGEIAEIFRHYTGLIAGMLRQLGFPAEVSGRNDITVDGRKVSGNAFYRTPQGASISHGTMLFSTDIAELSQAITPSRAKLESKGVKSVESRVTLLNRYTSMTIDEFVDRATRALCDSEYHLTNKDIEEVHAIEEGYYRPSWIMGKVSRAAHQRSRNIPGVGNMQAGVELTADGRIADLNISGDFFPRVDIDEAVIRPLRGVKYSREAVADVLSVHDPSAAIPGLTPELLLSLLF